MCLIPQDRFWVVIIQFVRMVKSKFLAQFLVDHLAHSVVSSFISFLCQFAAFAYYVLDRFVTIITSSTVTVLACLINSCSDMIGSYRRDSVSLLRFPFLSPVHVFSREMSLVSCLERSYSSFSSRFCFLVIFVLLILVSSILFLVTVISSPLRFSTWPSCRCINALSKCSDKNWNHRRLQAP